MVPALDGKTIVPEAEPGPSLSEAIDAEELPEPEKARYEEYVASGKLTKVTETVELASPANDIIVNAYNEQAESGNAFVFPIMVHISNPFLGNHCYDGATDSPIAVPFTTGETSPEPPNTPIHGFAGHLTTHGEGSVAEVQDATLVNNSYAAPGVHGCGYEGHADAAVNAGLGLPSPAGSNTTELVGNFQIASTEIIEETASKAALRTTAAATSERRKTQLLTTAWGPSRSAAGPARSRNERGDHETEMCGHSGGVGRRDERPCGERRHRPNRQKSDGVSPMRAVNTRTTSARRKRKVKR